MSDSPCDPNLAVDDTMDFCEPAILDDVFHEEKFVGDLRAEIACLYSHEGDFGIVLLRVLRKGVVDPAVTEYLFSRTGVHLSSSGHNAAYLYDIPVSAFIRAGIATMDLVVEALAACP